MCSQLNAPYLPYLIVANMLAKIMKHGKNFAKLNFDKKLRLENADGSHENGPAFFFPRSFRLRIPKWCKGLKGVHCVDLGESFPMSICLQNLQANTDTDTSENPSGTFSF